MLVLNSCGKDTKQSQSNLNGVTGEDTKFSQSLYGENAQVLIKGDLLGNGKISAVAGIVKQKTDNSFWIEKASFIQKEKDGWKVILKMEEKLSSENGDLISQVNAVNGYIISFDTTKKPVSINIVMANEYGKASSDEAVLKWNSSGNTFRFVAPYEEMP